MSFDSLPALLRTLKMQNKTAKSGGLSFEGEYKVEHDPTVLDEKEYIQVVCQHIFWATGYCWR